jgi:hypothetical protein
MLRFFKPITVADARAQQTHALQSIDVEMKAITDERRRLELQRPGAGRPRKLLDADKVLTAAAAAVADEPHSKRCKYTNWFASPHIHDILAAYQLNLHSAKKTVAYLQCRFPQLPTESEPRFLHLNESTVRSWHDSEDGRLKDRFQQLIDEQKTAASRGPGRAAVLRGHPEVEDEIVRVLRTMRGRGAVVNIAVIRLVMRAVFEEKEPQLLAELTLCKAWISCWARDVMHWSWRLKTTAASKLPNDWREQGIEAAKRVGWNMQIYKVHPSLVVNMDQTGVHLAPVDSRTYESTGSKEVMMIGAEDKRQITACIASSLDGDLLPLQLIFQGKTNACHPPSTAASDAAHVHLTHSENHWSNQQTMKDWITEVLVPYAARAAARHTLPADSHMVLVLDVWAVHKSEEFRKFLRMHHPNIHLVFVPPNCTSRLQVADVVLQRPFKHALRQGFNAWAATIIKEQIQNDELVGLSPYLKMSVIKPYILQWCIDSWTQMQTGHGREYIKTGWHTCCTSLFNVRDPIKRAQVVEAVARGELEGAFVPNQSETASDSSDSEGEEEDEDKDVLDVMKERQYGKRKSQRKRAQPSVSGYLLNSSQIALSEDSES